MLDSAAVALVGANAFTTAELGRCHDGWDGSREGVERFVTAWIIGRRRDPTVGVTLGLRGGVWHLVKMERTVEPYSAVEARIAYRTQGFPGVHIVEHNGAGDPIIATLPKSVIPFLTTAWSRFQALKALQELIQHGAFKYPAPTSPSVTPETAHLDRELQLYEFDSPHLVQNSLLAVAVAVFLSEPG